MSPRVRSLLDLLFGVVLIVIGLRWVVRSFGDAVADDWIRWVLLAGGVIAVALGVRRLVDTVRRRSQPGRRPDRPAEPT